MHLQPLCLVWQDGIYQCTLPSWVSSTTANLDSGRDIAQPLSTGADWLQGPYIYSLYREQYGLPERLVAFLFVLGFLTAGVAAPLVGVWADQ